MYHAKEINQVLNEVETTSLGLTNIEAKKRIGKKGYNELVSKKQKSVLGMLVAQLNDTMVIILAIAAFLSFLFADLLEGFVIIFIIIIDALVGVWQENRAKNAILSLRKLAPSTCKVLRDDKETLLESKYIVEGDIVIIEEGDLIPADIRLIETHGLRLIESSLTGEALAINKEANKICDIASPIMERSNMAYSSSLATYGHGVGVVVKTGMETEVGRIAHMLNSTAKFDTPLKKKLNKVAKILSVVGILVCIVIMAIGLLHHKPWHPLLMVAIALAISIIPEGLPATSTIVLALGVERMAKKQALIRNLPAVETLGSTSVICTDKTGTLTANMTEVIAIVEINRVTNLKNYSENVINKEILMCSALCNNVRLQNDALVGDPTEIALAKMVNKSYETLREKFSRQLEIPFDAERKIMTSVNKIFDQDIAYIKGAPEEIIKKCDYILEGNMIRRITEIDIKYFLQQVNEFSDKACRIISFAKKELSNKQELNRIEEGLTFLGLCAMIDPPRKEIKSTIEATDRAGIKTVIITGDYLKTAQVVGEAVGIIDKEPVLGYELVNMDDEQLASLVKKHTIFARISPYDKLRIVRAFQKNGEIVAMTGDGVNDAPSLKAADIGIAMGKSGTEVAKDAADMILLDDNYSNIVEAVFEGRRVYKNIEKVIQFLLAGNVAEIMTLLIATIFNFKYMPLLAIHVLWINLVTDTLPALALGVDEASRELLEEKPRKKSSLFTKTMVYRIIFHGALISFATLAAYFIGYSKSMALSGMEVFANSVAQTMAFAVLALSQLIHAFNQRSNVESIFKKPTKHNKYLNYAMIVSIALLITILFVPKCREIFNFEVLNLKDWWIVLLCSFVPLAGVETSKLIIRIKKKRKKR